MVTKFCKLSQNRRLLRIVIKTLKVTGLLTNPTHFVSKRAEIS